VLAPFPYQRNLEVVLMVAGQDKKGSRRPHAVRPNSTASLQLLRSRGSISRHPLRDARLPSARVRCESLVDLAPRGYALYGDLLIYSPPHLSALRS